MQRQPPHLDESTSASPGLSPGTVQDQETLLRIVIDPDHFTGGRIQPSAIQIRDLTQRGLSVHRREHTSRQEIKRAIHTMLGRTTATGFRTVEGLASFTAAAVRGDKKRGASNLCGDRHSSAGQQGACVHIPVGLPGETKPGQRDERAPAQPDGKPGPPRNRHSPGNEQDQVPGTRHTRSSRRKRTVDPGGTALSQQTPPVRA